MKKQDQGFWIQDAEPEAALPYPESRILNPETARRLQWRCRRGLLELDIVLGRFIDAHYAKLDEVELRAFDALLDMPDTVFWDMISGKNDAVPAEQQALLEKLRAI